MIFKDWQKNWGLADKIFNPQEVSILTEKAQKIKLETIVYCSFENRFAKSGGLGAVTKMILPFLDSYSSKTKAILLTPYYPYIFKNNELKNSGINFMMEFGAEKVEVEVFENHVDYDMPAVGSYKEYFIKSDGFFNAFNGLNDPYLYDENNNGKNEAALKKNALFFSKAACLVLNKLNFKKNIIFHLQEWQTALISLTAKEAVLDGLLTSAASVQTMHNPYDCFFEWKELKVISKRFHFSAIDKIKKYYSKEIQGLTAYQIGLDLIDAPITTVSKNFAEELTEDILQKEHFAPHLQNLFFKNKIYGINNGMFENYPEFYKKFREITKEEVKRIKNEKRKALLQIIEAYDKSKTIGELTYDNKSILELPSEVPIFTMGGRVDLNQKGYDVFLESLKYFKKDEIKVILTPLGSNEKDLSYFKKKALECKGNLLVITGRMEQGFNELRMGSSFGVMPSIYEPFGAAIEYLVFGTVVIARKTGGLGDQIDKKSGFLYYEEYEFKKKEIEDFCNSKNDPEKRLKNGWATEMTKSLKKIIRKVIKFYKSEELYYNMIMNGFLKAESFSWEISTKEYFKIYKMVNR